MKQFTGPLPDIVYDADLIGFPPGDVLFLDIETTGFSADHNFLYLIGVVSFDGQQWQSVQWFSELPQEEPVILSAFLDYAADRKALIHFNGNTFDLPFLIRKAHRYSLPETLSEKTSVDLFRTLRPLGRLWHMEHMTLSAWNTFLGGQRTDGVTGKDLIAVYQKYVSGYFPEVLDLLLLHNAEDLRCLTDITRLCRCLALLQGEAAFTVTEVRPASTALQIRLTLPFLLPYGITFAKELPETGAALQITARKETQEVFLSVPLYTGILYHYLADYKDYYYLPLEDMAIHKSVASFVSKEYRTQARPDTCYVKKEGTFVFQPDPFFSPVFKQKGGKLLFFELTEQMASTPGIFLPYVRSLLRSSLDMR